MLTAFLSLAVLAAANGANDVSRAAATLMGGRVTRYPQAMRWVVFFTLVGSLLSGWLAAGVARRFAAVLGSDPAHLRVAVPAVLLGASLWIALATWRKLPVATTHALVGCLLGVTWIWGGWAACLRIDLAKGFVIPLLASPLISAAGALLLSAFVRRLPSPGLAAVHRLHWFSAGMTALTRGINDSAKIWAILLPLALVLGARPQPFAQGAQITVAVAMLAGSIVAGRRVTETLAFGIVPMSGMEGSTANLVTATVITMASLLSFPVASSHVVSGAIFGVGLAGHRQLLRWQTLATMASAWVLTLPAAAFISVALYRAFSHLRDTPGDAFWFYPIGVLALMTAAGLLLKEKRSRKAILPTRLIVFVCNSNTSRSPMASQICASLLARLQLETQITVISRGLSATEGEPLFSFAASALNGIRVPASAHSAANLDEETALKADSILCMTRDQVQLIKERFPSVAGKVHVLDPQRDIPNPAGKPQVAFDRVAALLTIALDARLNSILAS